MKGIQYTLLSCKVMQPLSIHREDKFRRLYRRNVSVSAPCQAEGSRRRSIRTRCSSHWAGSSYRCTAWSSGHSHYSSRSPGDLSSHTRNLGHINTVIIAAVLYQCSISHFYTRSINHSSLLHISDTRCRDIDMTCQWTKTLIDNKGK